MQYALVAAAALGALPSAIAWGTEGHEAVAYVAQNFVVDEVKTATQKLLNDTGEDWLANIATWADSYRYTDDGEWSAPLHYLDAKDNPPSKCDVDFDRDCPEEGCVVSAIMNYTERAVDKNLSAADQGEAVKFIVHFLGDIHQPLHNEELEIGGNDIDVKFGSEDTNLHHVWDSNIIEKAFGSPTLGHAKAYAGKLVEEIKNGNYSKDAKSWTKDMDIDDAKASALSWSADSNTYVCSVVMPDGVAGVENKDLSGNYTDAALPAINELVARGGYRLAAWLNLIFTGDTGGL